MTQSKSAGYFRSGLPYNRSGRGPRPLVVFQGLMLENKPLPRMAPGMGKAPICSERRVRRSTVRLAYSGEVRAM
jgi:hypothetical protein